MSASRPTPRAGIYFVVRLPAGWEVVALRAGEAGVAEPDHYSVWPRSVLPLLAKAWAPKLPAAARGALRQLADCHAAFPRGRVTAVAGRPPTVFHGGDLPAREAARLRREIAAAFRLAKGARWEFDDHERCLAHDRDLAREILGIKETWDAA